MPNKPITRRGFFQETFQALQLTSNQPSNAETLPFYDRSGITPTAYFYRQHLQHIPQITPIYWMFRLYGQVEKPVILGYDDLRNMESIEQTYTLACLGGSARNPMLSNARWRGVPMEQILDKVKLLADSSYAQLYAADGYTTYVETSVLQNAVLAYEMNGEPLPPEHGYPARLIVPGRYGYKMPKWIQRIEFTQQPTPGFWEQRGWSSTGDIQATSLIVSPRHLETVSGGIQVAGVAYAGERTIVGVEVSINDSPWMPVPIRASKPYEWTPWRIDWTPTSAGDVLIKVRATDSDGFTQPDATTTRASSSSKAATALHSIIVHIAL